MPYYHSQPSAHSSNPKKKKTKLLEELNSGPLIWQVGSGVTKLDWLSLLCMTTYTSVPHSWGLWVTTLSQWLFISKAQGASCIWEFVLVCVTERRMWQSLKGWTLGLDPKTPQGQVGLLGKQARSSHLRGLFWSRFCFDFVLRGKWGLWRCWLRHLGSKFW